MPFYYDHLFNVFIVVYCSAQRYYNNNVRRVFGARKIIGPVMPKTGTTLLFRRGGIDGGDKGATRAKKKKIRLPVGRLAKADVATTTVVLLQLCATAAVVASRTRSDR